MSGGADDAQVRHSAASSAFANSKCGCSMPLGVSTTIRWVWNRPFWLQLHGWLACRLLLGRTGACEASDVFNADMVSPTSP